MKRPTKDQAELSLYLTLIIGFFIFGVVRDGLVETLVVFGLIATIIFVVFPVASALVRKIGR